MALTTGAAVLLIATAVLVTASASRQAAPEPRQAGAANGIIKVGPGQDLQAALDRARPGDTLLLAQGATFTGNFVLGVTQGDGFVTIRTDAEGLPADGVRMTPEYSGRLAVLQSPNNAPALRTAAGAHHWRIENLEFGPNRGGEGNIIELGDASARQSRAADVPQALVLDRLYVHGDPISGQKRGIALNSGSTEIVNSWIADIKAMGVDAQAIAGWNGPGPYRIENNYLEAAGENILFGGGDPHIVELVPSAITIRRNHITRPPSWRDGILPAPAKVEATARTGGRLAAGEYTYTIVAERKVAGGGTARSGPGATATIEAASEGAVALRWDAVPGAASYRVYRSERSGSSKESVYWPVAAPGFTDTGAAGETGAPPRRASSWTIKNLLELKNARDVEIDGNVFEYHWPAAQAGYAILLTPRNQEGGAPWSRVEDVRFSNNIVRHVSAGINISGTDDEYPSGRAENIVIRNNLFADVGGDWGRPGDFVQVGNGPRAITIESNTVAQTGRIISAYGSKLGLRVDGLVFRRNVVRHNKYGIIGGNAAPGTSTFRMYFPDAEFTGNVIAGGDASKYPPGNEFIAGDRFDEQFVDAAGGDFRRKPAELARAAERPGADMEAIDKATAGVAGPIATRAANERTSR